MNHISACLNEKLKSIHQHIKQIETLSQHLNEYLPASLIKECKVGSFNKGCLVLIVQDATWASQLRYMLPELRDKLRNKAGFYQLTAIKISVLSDYQAETTSIKNRKVNLSSKALDVIIEQAEQCTYLPLRKALEKLAT